MQFRAIKMTKIVHITKQENKVSMKRYDFTVNYTVSILTMLELFSK